LGAAQPSVLAEDWAAFDPYGPNPYGPNPYRPDPRQVRGRLEDLLGRMRAAGRWPWKGAVLVLYRDGVLPRLCDALPDASEAARWRAEIEVEAARLDALDLAA